VRSMTTRGVAAEVVGLNSQSEALHGRLTGQHVGAH
jgi:hypothetical protein